MLKPKIIMAIALISLSILLPSCARRMVKYGKITTPGVTIVAEDGTFTLKSGKVFTPPFQSQLNGHYIRALNGGSVWDLVDRGDGKKVRVILSNKKLYGYLIFLTVYDDTSAVTRSYQISIPDSYIKQASNGRRTVIYEWYTRGGDKVPTWILWLSDIPF